MTVPNRRLVAAAIAILAATVGIATPAHADETEALAEVSSIAANADGTFTKRIFTPAPDVTPTELARMLTESGVPNVVVRTESEVSAQAAACALGTARTWPSSATCFVRWAYKGQPRPILHFLDRTSAAWPVGRAATEWNTVSGIDSIRRTPAAGCLSSAHCVDMVSANYGNTGWAGETHVHLNDAQTYATNAAVYLNDYYANNETERWTVACHEMGHVLGLGHNTSTGSCLYYKLTAGMSKYPNANDKALIERYY
jgi:hypothetical protein